ncbi:MAG TPA: ATP-binding protein [Cyclobacteriaceae bacterium]
MRSVWLLILIFICSSVTAQHYQYKQYRVENGLPTDIIKSIAQDSAGYFWIASDEGIIKYDGVNFTSYRKALHSQYAKGLVTTQSGRLLLFGDLDLIEIKRQKDTVLFQSIREGTRNRNDSMLWYPKSLYEDKLNSYWVSEPQSIVRLQDNHLERFDFDIKERSPRFLRSFSFFEDLQGNFFTTSYLGNVYQFHPDLNKFIPDKGKFPSFISHLIILNNQLWLGTDTGVYAAQLKPEGGFEKPILKYSLENVSYLLPLPDSSLLVCTRGTSQFIITDGEIQQLPFAVDEVNHAYLSRENDLWLSCNAGIFLIQKNTFINDTPQVNNFIESITENERNHEIFYATTSNIYALQLKNGIANNRQILSFPDGYFQSIAYHNGGFWAINNTFLMFIQDGKVRHRFIPEGSGHFMPDLFLDSKKMVWASQSSDPYAWVADSLFHARKFLVPINKENNINLFREGPDGMYAASTGKSKYLFYKSPSDTSFKDISLPVTFETSGDFNITDLAFTDDIIWMATTEGLIRYDHKTITRVDIGNIFTGLPVKAIEVYMDGSLLFNTRHGLIRFSPRTGEHWLFDESNGLPSNTITTRGLFIDDEHHIWVGTSRGLAHNPKPLMNQGKTLQPKFVDAKINGKSIRLSRLKSIPYGSYLTLFVSSITFPENKVDLKYKINSDTNWHTINNSVINFTGITPGFHKIEVKAKKNGDLAWSEPGTFSFYVAFPFWRQSWFYILCFILVAAVAFLSVAWANYSNTIRRKQLQRLIELQTQELKWSNEELSTRNAELDKFVYSASHDLSAPLKSILGLIMVAKMEKPSEQMIHYLTMMESSVEKLELFIRDVVNYSRNARLPVEKKAISFTSFIQSIWDEHQFSSSVNKIRLEIKDGLQNVFYADEVRLRIVFNNLISNAIKFHYVEHREDPIVRVIAKETGTGYEFCVEDNGRGIHQDMKDKIFEMFFRATDSIPGSGLGLYILKEAIQKLGGTVQVESELGKGCKFIIHLPK